jgi:hypothetical protein
MSGSCQRTLHLSGNSINCHFTLTGSLPQGAAAGGPPPDGPGTVDPPVTRLGGMGIPIQVVFDCSDPPVVARFWAGALGHGRQGPPEPTAVWRAWQARLAEHGVPGGWTL